VVGHVLLLPDNALCKLAPATARRKQNMNRRWQALARPVPLQLHSRFKPSFNQRHHGSGLGVSGFAVHHRAGPATCRNFKALAVLVVVLAVFASCAGRYQAALLRDRLEARHGAWAGTRFPLRRCGLRSTSGADAGQSSGDKVVNRAVIHRRRRSIMRADSYRGKFQPVFGAYGRTKFFPIQIDPAGH